MNTIGLIFTLFIAVIVLCMPRRVAVLGLIAAVCYLTQGQQTTIAGFHFTSMRLILLAGVIRIIARHEFKDIRFNFIDKCVVAYVVSTIIIPVIRADGAMSVLVYCLGRSYDILLSYFLFRALLKNLQEIKLFFADVAVVIVPFSFFMMLESLNGRNFFNAFGGVNASDEFRSGHFRCEAAFRSPITAGTFGATLMPFFAGLYLTGQRRRHAVIGAAAATMIVICSRSSGPLLAYGSGLLALLLWRWRDYMRLLRWAVLITLVSLQLYMKAPVWFLMGHVSDIVGGGGWYRAEIVDEAVNHFGSWWLLGTSDTASWTATPLAVNGEADLTNQFVSAGVCGGLLSLIIFVIIFVQSFSCLGRAMQKVRGIDRDIEIFLWAIGASLYATLVNFFSVSYFDQIEVVWYLLLAIISTAAFNVLGEKSIVEWQSNATMEDSKADFTRQSPLNCCK